MRTVVPRSGKCTTLNKRSVLPQNLHFLAGRLSVSPIFSALKSSIHGPQAKGVHATMGHKICSAGGQNLTYEIAGLKCAPRCVPLVNTRSQNKRVTDYQHLLFWSGELRVGASVRAIDVLIVQLFLAKPPDREKNGTRAYFEAAPNGFSIRASPGNA